MPLPSIRVKVLARWTLGRHLQEVGDSHNTEGVHTCLPGPSPRLAFCEHISEAAARGHPSSAHMSRRLGLLRRWGVEHPELHAGQTLNVLAGHLSQDFPQGTCMLGWW